MIVRLATGAEMDRPPRPLKMALPVSRVRVVTTVPRAPSARPVPTGYVVQQYQPEELGRVPAV